MHQWMQNFMGKSKYYNKMTKQLKKNGQTGRVK